MSKELEEKKQQLEALRIEVLTMEGEERLQKHYPEMKRKEGTFWKRRNFYSLPKEESDYWWIHTYIKKVNPDGTFVSVEFETDKRGNVTIRPETLRGWESPDDGQCYSNAQEWDEALERVRSAVSEMTKIAGEDHS